MGDYIKKPYLRGDRDNVNDLLAKLIRNLPEQKSIDADQIANAVANALSSKINVNAVQVSEKHIDVADSSDARSMEKLAQSMIVQRGDKEANFEDLGGTQETKKNKEEVQNTIDLLRDLDD